MKRIDVSVPPDLALPNFPGKAPFRAAPVARRAPGGRVTLPAAFYVSRVCLGAHADRKSCLPLRLVESEGAHIRVVPRRN